MDEQRSTAADADGGVDPPAGTSDPDAAVVDAAPQVAELPGVDYHQSSLWRWRGPASLIGGALFGIFGLLLVAGAVAFSGDDALANARPADLVQILDSVESENDRLAGEQRALQAELDALVAGTSQEALARSRERLESLEVLAGTTPVQGPGIRMVIRDPAGVIDAADILNAVQELRDAGAESIEVAQRRVVVDTWFADPGEEAGEGILISGDLRGSPYTVLAIGDPQTLSTAMQIPGGLADSVRTAGAVFELEMRDELEISATVPLATPDYAEPVAAP
jgi:uncharacterized protein YlxW (UPF0749 family)